MDGTGLRFRDTGIAATVKDEGEWGDLLLDGGVSLFGSIDAATGEIVAVLLNTSPTRAAASSVSLSGCGARGGAELRTYAGSADGFAPGRATVAQEQVSLTLPPYSISVLRLPA